MKMASINMKNITLETGGKSPLLVFDDANLDLTAKWSHIGIMSNMGQICSATRRILVQESIHDRFVSLFLNQVKKVSEVGDTRAQYDKIRSHIESGQSEGATLATGGVITDQTDKEKERGKGFFISPHCRHQGVGPHEHLPR